MADPGATNGKEAIASTPATNSHKQKEPLFPITTSGLDRLLAYKYDESTNSHYLIANQDLAPNTHIAYITTHTPVPEPLYSTVQTSRTTHIELNSPLLYLNHSCAPTASITIFSPDAATGLYPTTLPGTFTPGLDAPESAEAGEPGIAGEVRISERGVKAGEAVTFFYPCTEWSMGRGFDCNCRAAECLGRIEGAKGLRREQMEGKGEVGRWIWEGMRARDGV